MDVPVAPLLVPDAVLAEAQERRVIVGLCGGPGSGKSTLAREWADAAAVDRPELAPRVVPMDGFHLDAQTLAARGLLEVKGAPETFDVDAFIALLGQLRTGAQVFAPEYDRSLHAAVMGRVDVPEQCRLVIVEGNYLGLRTGAWAQVRGLLEFLWRVDVPWEVARNRLIARHVAGGRSRADAVAWVDRVDAANFALVHRPR